MKPVRPLSAASCIFFGGVLFSSNSNILNCEAVDNIKVSKVAVQTQVDGYAHKPPADRIKTASSSTCIDLCL